MSRGCARRSWDSSLIVRTGGALVASFADHESRSRTLACADHRLPRARPDARVAAAATTPRRSCRARRPPRVRLHLDNRPRARVGDDRAANPRTGRRTAAVHAPSSSGSTPSVSRICPRVRERTHRTVRFRRGSRHRSARRRRSGHPGCRGRGRVSGSRSQVARLVPESGNSAGTDLRGLRRSPRGHVPPRAVRRRKRGAAGYNDGTSPPNGFPMPASAPIPRSFVGRFAHMMRIGD